MVTAGFRPMIAALIAAFALTGCDRAKPPSPVTNRTETVATQVTSSTTDSGEPSSLKASKLQSVPSETTSNAPTTPEPIYRPADRRPPHDDRRLAEAGIRLFESKRLKLYTDIDEEVARTLPPLVDAIYPAWGEYFGELPPDRADSDFQMTGYLIREEALFREAGLVPEDLPLFEHGRHRRNEFWMREQQYDYFRRHLLLHEATHCFMTYMPDVNAPVWYIEGMAEHFATHRVESDGTVTFRVMPTSPEDFAGWGRIKGIRDEYTAGNAKSIRDVLAMQPTDFLKPQPYAWSWGLCHFLDTHPRYREQFRELGEHLQGSALPREFSTAFDDDARELTSEWLLFITYLQYGYEASRAAIDFRPGSALTAERLVHACDITADRGWQSSGVLLEEGQTYEIAATGRFSLADQPKPWTSEPQGISFRYFDRRPLGKLLGCLRTESGDAGGETDSMLKVIEIGSGRSLTSPSTGTLYLRVNEAWNSLSDNRGQVTVEVRRTESAK